MTPEELLSAWQRHHGALSSSLQAEFLSRLELTQILEYSNAAIEFHLPFHPKLKRLLQRLGGDRRVAKMKTLPSSEASIRSGGAQRGSTQAIESGVRQLKKPNNPNVNRTKSMSERPTKGENKRLRKIAQENRWWE